MRAKKSESLPGSSVKDLRGRRFGKLVVTDFAGRDKHDYPLWKCVCDCGGERQVRSQELRRGDTKSCGCIRSERMKASKTTHGTYREDWAGCWRAMVNRTSRPNCAQFPEYGAKGIKIEDPRWFDPHEFFKDMGPRPSQNHSIDRIDVLKGYYKENCRWADKKTQQNNRRCNVFVSFQGIRMTHAQWEEKLGLGRGVIGLRLKAGWSIEKALLTAPKEKGCPIEGQPLIDGAGI